MFSTRCQITCDTLWIVGKPLQLDLHLIPNYLRLRSLVCSRIYCRIIWHEACYTAVVDVVQIVLDSRCVGYLLPARRTVCESIVFHDNNNSSIFCQLHNGGVSVGQVVQYTAALTFSVLEVGRFGTACHAGTSSFCLKPYRHFLSHKYHAVWPMRATMHANAKTYRLVIINRVWDNYVHKKTVSQSREARFSVEMHQNPLGSGAGLSQDPSGKLTALRRRLAEFRGEGPREEVEKGKERSGEAGRKGKWREWSEGKGREKKGKGMKQGERKGREKRWRNSIPALFRFR